MGIQVDVTGVTKMISSKTHKQSNENHKRAIEGQNHELGMGCCTSIGTNVRNKDNQRLYVS